MIYLDTSALVKLVFAEPESKALAAWLSLREDVAKVSSEIATVELLRSCRRHGADAVVDGRVVLAGLDLVPLTRDVVELALAADPPQLRSLDAVHLASALAIADSLVSFVAYDARLLDAAAAAGLSVVAPPDRE